MVKDWWKKFFDVHAAEVMFDLQNRPTRQEVHQVLKKTRIKGGASILDLACGLGRHSIEFANRGMNVTGLDYSQEYVRRARHEVKVAKLESKVKIVQGDMRDLSRFDPHQFDMVVSLFNSFGYFDKRSDDFKVLYEIARVVKPGGVLVLNTLNRAGVESRLCEVPTLMNLDGFYFWKEPKPNFFILDKATYNKKKQRTQCEWVLIGTKKKSPRILRLGFGQNVYSHEDLKKALRPLEFRVEAIWGRLSGEPFSPKKSWHQTFVARKAK